MTAPTKYGYMTHTVNGGPMGTIPVHQKCTGSAIDDFYNSRMTMESGLISLAENDNSNHNSSDTQTDADNTLAAMEEVAQALTSPQSFLERMRQQQAEVGRELETYFKRFEIARKQREGLQRYYEQRRRGGKSNAQAKTNKSQ
jgi:hypothetical protein